MLCLYVMLHAFFSTELQVATLEKKHNVTDRWLPTSEQYQDQATSFEDKKKVQLLMKLRQLLVEKEFLYETRKKYSGMYMLVVPRQGSYICNNEGIPKTSVKSNFSSWTYNVKNVLLSSLICDQLCHDLSWDSGTVF